MSFESTNADFFADIHCHSTLRAINTLTTHRQHSIWAKTESIIADTALSKWASSQTKDIAKESQANLYAMAQGNVQLVFDSLYPVEKGFLNFRRVPELIVGQNGSASMLQSVTGLERNRLKDMRGHYDYFYELEEQYHFLRDGQGDSPCGSYAYKLLNNYETVKNIIQQSGRTIGIIPTIEGAHAFGCGLRSTANITLPKHKKLLSSNIRRVKQWAHPPFFVTFAHHFWNQLCGHVRSMKPLMYAMFNQKKGMNQGMTALGWHVVRELLSGQNGRRILLDIKHMSVQARRDYFHFVETYNHLNPADYIPIICSHTGVNAHSNMEAATAQPDRALKLKRGYFHEWSINLSDEEIRIIHQSKGLIGVILDKSVLGSSTTLKEIQQLTNPEKQKEAFIRLILENILHIPKVIQQKSAWDLICFGSDYDGMIKHVDCYENASCFPQLKKDLIAYLHEHQFHKYYWFGYTPEELMHKVMIGNVLCFLERHF